MNSLDDDALNLAYDQVVGTNHFFIVSALTDYYGPNASLLKCRFKVLDSDGNVIILAVDSTFGWVRSIGGYKSDRNCDIKFVDPKSGTNLYMISSRRQLIKPSVTISRVLKDNHLVGLIRETGKYEKLKYEVCDSHGNTLFIIRPVKKYSPDKPCPSVWRTAFPTYGKCKFCPREYLVLSPNENSKIGRISTQWRDKIYRKDIREKQLDNKRRRKGKVTTSSTALGVRESNSTLPPQRIEVENLEYDSSSCDEDLVGIDYYRCTRNFGVEFLTFVNPYSKSLILGALFMIFYRCVMEANTISYAEQKAIKWRHHTTIYTTLLCLVVFILLIFYYFTLISSTKN